MKRVPLLLVELSIAVIILAMPLLMFSPVVSAAGVSLTTSPVSEVISSNPGTVATTVLHVQNNGLLPVPMTIKLFAFGAAGTTGSPSLQPASPSDTYFSWAHFSPDAFIAQPDVPVAVTMTIDIPKTAALGYNYGVAFEPIISASLNGPGAVLNGSNVILILLDTTSANEIHSAQIASFTASKRLYEYLPATFLINVHNNGNIFIAPGLNIYISRTANFLPGSIIDTININSAQGNVLPNSNRVFQAQWTDGFPVFQPKLVDGHQITKKNQTIYQLNWNFSKVDKLRFGKYYAKLIMSYNNGKRQVPIVAVLSFWVVPWKLLILILLLVLVFIGLIIFVVYLVHRLRKLQRGTSRRHV